MSALGVLVVLGGLGVPGPAGAWPAIQDLTGVHLCNARPVQEPDGQWSCRSGGVSYLGSLVDVTQGPGAPPGAPPGGRPPYGAPGPYGAYGPAWRSWGPPPREPSGYDALGPWLGNPSDR